MFAALLLIRRPRRLWHLRRIAATDGPTTRTLLPGRLAPLRHSTLPPLPPAFRPAAIPPDPGAPDKEEMDVRARLQAAIDGRPMSPAPQPEARHD
ncbi:hypothetical protein [Streptomyces tubercidicus]|uniref:hypothetical protein n=1 Tax=Streptomyces tubercidicus TaxID=47759 RepID=UPI002E12753B|nr:hypothetical protein OG761_23350 [Streptomyces tubercidicus]